MIPKNQKQLFPEKSDAEFLGYIQIIKRTIVSFFRNLYDRIDKNGDGEVTEDELKNWIKYTQNKYIWEDAAKQMQSSDENSDGYVDWTEYKKSTYGFVTEEGNINLLITTTKWSNPLRQFVDCCRQIV